MTILTQFSDPYDRRARLCPMLIVLLPLALIAASWISGDWPIPGMLGGTAVAVALAAFLSQLARDQGKAKQPALWEKWGGKPSVVALQYRSGTTNEATLRRYHDKLHLLAPKLWFPTSMDEELADPENADASYESASDLLLAKTRDKTRFPLVFAENTNYGFRRNLWAMKPAGLTTSLVGTVGSAVRVGYLWVANGEPPYVAAVSAIVSVMLLVLWITRISPSWVEIAAKDFAKQLLNACDEL